MRLGVIIAAGGVGSRMQTGSSKQLMELDGVPVLARTTLLFEGHEAVEEIVIAIDQKDILHCRMEVIDKYGFGKVKVVVPGGANRALSVKNALGMLNKEIDVVAVHDGARPLFPLELLGEGLKALDEDFWDGVVFGLPLTDTVKQVDQSSGRVESTLDRQRIWAVQTPQIFRREIFEAAYSAAPGKLEKATDDSFLVELAGGRVRMIPGSRENIKLTVPIDILFAEEIIRSRVK